MEWKDIKGYNGLYKCNENGEILNAKTSHILKPFSYGGHLGVNLCLNGKRKSFYIHRLIYETFVGEIPEGFIICHLDCNNNNNKLSNLKLYKSIKNRYADTEACIILHSSGGKKAIYAETIDGEIWTDVIDTDGNYKVSNIGRVKNTKTNRLVRPYIKRKKYHWIQLKSGGINIHASLHKLIYESFNGKIKQGNEVDHINSNSLDDRLDNLKEVTREENVKNVNSVNKMQINRHNALLKKGGKSGIGILKLDTKGNILEKYKSAKQCAEANNIDAKILRNYVNGKRKKIFNENFYFIKEFDYNQLKNNDELNIAME